MGDAEDRVALVVELTRAVSGRRRLDDVLLAAFGVLRPVLGFTGGSIQLVDDEGWVRVATADPPPYQPPAPIPLAGSVPGRIVITERPLYLADVPGDRQTADRLGAGHRVVRSYFGVPLVADGAAIGLLQIDADAPQAWDEEQRLTLTTAAPVLAAAIASTRASVRHGEMQHRLQGETQRRSEIQAFVRDEMAPTVAALSAACSGVEDVAGLAEAEQVRELRRQLRVCGAEARRLSGYVARLEAILVAELVADASRRRIVTLPDQPVPLQPRTGPEVGSP